MNPPYQLVLETSGVCGLRCPQCWIGLRWFDRGRAGYFMPMDLFDKIATEAKRFIRHTYLHLWGEPTMNPNLPEMIQRLKAFSTIDLATHGLLVDERLAEAIAQCDTVSVSIDGIDQQTYEQYRVGGSLERALHGLRLLVKRFKGKVNWTFVVFKNNEHQIPAARRLAEEIGAHIGFKPPLFWDRTQMDRLMPTDDKYRRYQMVDGEWQLKADRLKCREFWETVYVLADGKVLTCCYDGAAQYVTGDVTTTALLDVWNGPTYQSMRAAHSSGVLNEMCRKVCQLPA